MRNIIRRIFNKINDAFNEKQTYLLLNVFNRTYDRKVLVSYITAPFISGLSDRHTNLLECYSACEIFDELGFVVDIIDYDKTSHLVNYSDYRVIYGFGQSFENVFYWKGFSDSSITKIVYATGCDTVFSNKVSLNRIFDFYKKENLFCINSARVVNNTWRAQIMFSDLIIALGNEYVARTYSSYNLSKVSSIKIFFKDIGRINISAKNFSLAKNNFMWWGSAGAIHKGLDLVIDFFEKKPELNIFICGVCEEYPFNEYFMNKVKKCNNIFNMGFVQVGSKQHQELLMSCIATILPSASEGGAPGVVNACSIAGLIPIVTASCGIDIPESVSNFSLIDTTIEAIDISINNLHKLDDEQLLNTSIDVQNFYRNNHTLVSYKQNLKKFIIDAIND